MVPYRKVFEELFHRRVRYLVAGGFAVNFHQVQRATVDLDLVVHIEPANILAFVALMEELGYLPRLPIQARDLADEKMRHHWITDKGMMVFSFVHASNPMEVIDVFVKEPFPFEELFERRLDVAAFNITIPVLGKADLIRMKQMAGRDKDKFDIEQLKKTT